jgi:formylglycine-generating enzyme required for sulfatase activity
MGSRISPEDVFKKWGGKALRYENEQPLHRVKITKPFYLQATEITQEHWVKVWGANLSNFKNCGGDCPAEWIVWEKAIKFIRILNDMEGTKKYRLPTEAEWEYACRAGTESAFSFEKVDRLGEYAWYKGNSGGKTHPVGKKKPNAWGLYDMHGNVWEWVQDWYDNYPSNSVVDPKGPDKGEIRVMRGGGYSNNAGDLRSARRDWGHPKHRYSNFLHGFRVAKDF